MNPTTTTFYEDTGPPKDHAASLPARGTRTGVVNQTQYLPKRDSTHILSIAQRKGRRYPTRPQSDCRRSLGSARDDSRRTQLEAIALDEQASEDARESARADLWSEFPPVSPMNPHELPPNP
jgi:hypothetical protein